MTEEEDRRVAWRRAEAGVIEAPEHEMVRNVFRLTTAR